MRSNNRAKERIGEYRYNNNGSKMTIIEYNNNKDIVVMFENGDKYNTNYRNFEIGNVKSVYDKTVVGVGYEGYGFYKAKINNKITNQYQTWRNMIVRCYDEKHHEKYPSYIGCEVSEEWHNFQNFAKWYDENYYEVDRNEMQIEKDILVKGNKIYSPETCIFVPRKINNLFIKRANDRGKYPIGVYYDNCNKKFKAQCNDINNKRKNLGLFNTPEDAFEAYKSFKESLIKQVAEEYRNVIPIQLYYALVTYKIDIND